MNEPIFKSVFGKAWHTLPRVMINHYSNRPNTDDITVVEGTLDVTSKVPLTWLGSLMRFMGQIPIRNARNVPVTVEFRSDPDTKAFHLVRRFQFADGDYTFHSRMLQIKGDEVIEVMRYGFAWRMRYSWNGEKVILSHLGYSLYIFGHLIRLPLTSLLGKGYAEEIAIDDNQFDMVTNITHAWWGKVYEYKGRFKVIEDA